MRNSKKMHPKYGGIFMNLEKMMEYKEKSKELETKLINLKEQKKDIEDKIEKVQKELARNKRKAEEMFWGYFLDKDPVEAGALFPLPSDYWKDEEDEA